MHFRNGGYASTYFYLLSILTVYLFKQFVNSRFQLHIFPFHYRFRAIGNLNIRL